ncbi:MAG: tetratricopeptide repeat protein, partial [Myxococcota bacterium]
AHLEAVEEASAELQALRLRIRVEAGERRGVLRSARRLARDNPGDPAVGLALAQAALAARESRLAVDTLERTVAAAPTDPEVHYMLGRAQRALADADAAEAAFARTLELNPSFTDASVELGYLLLDTGQWERAEALFAPLARRRILTGRDYALIGRLGQVEALLGLGAIDDAKVQLGRVREGQRELGSVKRIEARVALADGRPGDAVRAVRALAEAEGAPVDVRVLFGDALYAAGETLPASAAYEGALADDPAHPEALLGFATVLIRGEKYDEATGVLERAAAALTERIRPPALRARLKYLEGRAALGAEDLATARESLEAATALTGVPPEAFFYLGEALSETNAREARAAYQQYLEREQDGALANRARRAIR